MSDDVERANEIVERMLREPRVQKIVADARLFDSLRENPAWQRLFQMVQSRKRKWMEDIASRLITPGAKPPTPEEIAYYQGFYQGAVFVLAHPEHAEKNLERAARVAWAMNSGDDEDPEEG